MSNKVYPNNDIVTSTQQNQLASSDSLSPRTTNIMPTNAELLVGYTGSRGLQGEKGDTGFTGSRGNQGQTGATGPSGPVGIRGPSGLRGLQGEIGFTGSRGQAGTNGTVGFVGSRGQMGPTGLTGPSGAPGTPGQRGDLGFTGSRGVTGEKGFTGSAGLGIRGSVGFTGSRGSQGERGDRGFVGSASTAPGFTGSQGDKGFTGSQGLPGTAAAVGFTGSAGGVGFTGSRGLDGQAAARGYTGSAGAGFTGSAGVGFTGSRGLLGPSGPTGPSGATGPTGPTGIRGYAGSQGPSMSTPGKGTGFRLTIFAGGTYDYGKIDAPGSGYEVGDRIRFLGTDLGGVSPDNDWILIVWGVGANGGVTDLSAPSWGVAIQGLQTFENVLGHNEGQFGLENLSRVSISNPQVGQALVYDGEVWVNNSAGGSGSGASTLAQLTDVQITTPTTGQVLTWNGTKWINNNASSGGGASTGLSTRTTITFAGGDATINGFKSYAILSIGTSAAAWVRVYTDRPSRTADSTSGRTVNTDPLPSAGILAEVITNGAEIVRFSPAAIGWNNDSPPNGNIYIRSTNLSNTSGVSGNITILRLEA